MRRTSPLFLPLAALFGASLPLFSAWAQNDQLKLTLRGQWPELPPMFGVLVNVAGDHAYVAGRGRFVVLSLANPTRPTLAGYCDLPGEDTITGVAAIGHTALVAAFDASGMAPGHVGYLHLVDITDAAQPKLIASRQFTRWCMGVSVSGNLAYIAAEEGGLLVFEVGDPPNLTQVAHLTLQGWARCVRVLGDRAYVGERVGDPQDYNTFQGYVEVVDVSTPSTPRVLGGCNTIGPYVYSLDAASDFIYVGNTGRDPNGGLEIIDARDPANPYVVGAVPDDSYIRAVQAAGPYVYATSDLHGLRVIDIHNPAQPVPVGSFTSERDALAVHGGAAAYVSRTSPGSRFSNCPCRGRSS